MDILIVTYTSTLCRLIHCEATLGQDHSKRRLYEVAVNKAEILNMSKFFLAGKNVRKKEERTWCVQQSY